MKIREKLLCGFLLVSLLTLAVSYGAGFLVQEKTVATFEEVGERILPGNVALARMTSELYHTLFLLSQYSEQSDEDTRLQIEKSLSTLSTFKTMHEVYHPSNEELHAQIEALIEEFSRAVAGYLLLLQKEYDQGEELAARRKIDSLLAVFVHSVNPHIEQEFAASFRKLADSKEKTLQARRVLFASSAVILFFALLLSFFIAHLLAKPLRTLSNAVREIGAGRLDLSLPVTSRDEISELTREFNAMAANLSVMRKELINAMDYADNIVNSMADALVVVAPTGAIQTVNATTCSLLGYQENELIGSPVGTIIAEELFQGEDLADLAARNAIRDLNVFFLAKSGDRISMSISGSALLSQEGEQQAIILVARDVREITRLVTELNKTNRQLKEEIVERILAKNALAAEKERLAVTLRSIGDGVITTDVQGKVVLVNKVAEELIGWSQNEAVGRPFAEVFNIIDARTRTPCANPVEKVLATGLNVALANHTLLIARDGTERSIADSGAPIRDRESRTIGVVLVFRDVTDEERREMELLKVKKLESIGVLAGGIAHDFNNILAAILGNISLAKDVSPPEGKAHRLLAQAEKASMRARDLTQQLLTFSKGGEPVKKIAAIPEIIEESARFVLRGSNVRCDFHFADDLWSVEVDSGQISQVIQNIVINADHAMPEGGLIEIRAGNIPAEEACRLSPELIRPCVLITIRDQGIGIPPELLDKIFDPYFSTKSRGSGLGLAISHSIIKKHSGHISASSEPGKGTIFTILLPAVREQQPLQTELPEELRLPESAHRVLLMDDEEMVREVAVQMLSHLGYEVLVAEEGQRAVELYRQSLADREPFDVIIMDLTIPGGMGGKEAAQQILAINDQARLIASSGYSNDPVVANPGAYGFREAICKPYQLHDLARVLARQLAVP